MKQVMICLLEEKEIPQDCCSSLLPQISYVLNSIPNASTGFTPYRIMYGVDPKPLSMTELNPDIIVVVFILITDLD